MARYLGGPCIATRSLIGPRTAFCRRSVCRLPFYLLCTPAAAHSARFCFFSLFSARRYKYGCRLGHRSVRFALSTGEHRSLPYPESAGLLQQQRRRHNPCSFAFTLRSVPYSGLPYKYEPNPDLPQSKLDRQPLRMFHSGPGVPSPMPGSWICKGIKAINENIVI